MTKCQKVPKCQSEAIVFIEIKFYKCNGTDFVLK